ncbi:phosphoribosyltransferase [Methanolacinia petrolearia DSM 11571]|uniref:Transcriptional regulator GfcR n=1 Tax=Methanolacinia petrolearia (strain DSM 11571 / OCM 486 / SEBR 4847) TaxID=679926 RepID=E1REN7_METP4|nr:orotate phosphoribosyltransferase-like protein [Methanolacinia petrolearia]ADN34984.1 phosphoribosyltransferase [Methanolacinia petrolearia DSM 11571]
MSSLDELISKARLLHSEGRSTSQISDELSLSAETVTWLLTREKSGGDVPRDVLIDWSSISCDSNNLCLAASMMAQRFYFAREQAGLSEEEGSGFPDVVIGIAHSGIPLATLIAGNEGAMFAMYHPKKHAQGDSPSGSLNSSFAGVSNRSCLIVDDVVTTGNTITEAIEYIRKHGGEPVGILVLFDKRGLKEIGGVPLYSLVKVERID